MAQKQLSTNTIAFVGLCSEYCAALDSALDYELNDFVGRMLGLLPRIYIVATDLTTTDERGYIETGFIDPTLEEDQYEAVRRGLEQLMGEDDTYLEVFEEDMKYSDTPIGASIAEGLSDLYQVFYNFLATVRDASDDLVEEAVTAVLDDFGSYWSQILCNLLRPLNALKVRG